MLLFYLVFLCMIIYGFFLLLRRTYVLILLVLVIVLLLIEDADGATLEYDLSLISSKTVDCYNKYVQTFTFNKSWKEIIQELAELLTHCDILARLMSNKLGDLGSLNCNLRYSSMTKSDL